MDMPMGKGGGAPAGGCTPEEHAAKMQALAEILEFASGREAEGLKTKYRPAPAPPPAGEPAAEGAPAEGDPLAGMSEDELLALLG